MHLITPYKQPIVKLKLTRDLVRTIKRGHPWVFAEALRQQHKVEPGTHALLLDHKKGREVAKGYYHPHSPLAFRVCSLDTADQLNDAWAEKRMDQALLLRQSLFDHQTTGFRLFNGEGDGLPGLICDIYDKTAVIQLDGLAASNFWHVSGIAKWLTTTLALKTVYLKGQSRRKAPSQLLTGENPTSTYFLENGVRFTANIIDGQKTGFFLDQRDNRQQIRMIAKNRRVLNLFGYTGGFSVYAGLGGARHVITVDVARPALKTAEYHWQLNELPEASHQIIKADVFDFLAEAARKKDLWDLIIVDPPSFTSAKESVKKATAAYQNLIAAAATVTSPGGFLAVASCSSHIDMPAFLDICEAAISKARRRATLLQLNQQPPDHPTPLPFSEFRYLKFVLMRVEM